MKRCLVIKFNLIVENLEEKQFKELKKILRAKYENRNKP